MMNYLYGGAQPADENADPALAVGEACSKHGEFQRNEDGTLCYEDFLIFRAICMRQASRQSAAAKAAINTRKLEALRAQNHYDYANCWGEVQIESKKALNAMTKEAGRAIGLEPLFYENTMRLYMADKTKQPEITLKDSEVRMALESLAVSETREKILEVAKFHMKRDLEMSHKMQSLRGMMRPDHFAQAMAIEHSKTNDGLQIEYGFELGHLGIAVKHYNLEEELNTFRSEFVAQKKAEVQAKLDACTPAPAVIEQLIADGKKLGLPQIQADGTMPFQYFLETRKIVTLYVIRATKEQLDAQQIKRRAAVAAGDDEEYDRVVDEMDQTKQFVAGAIQSSLYKALGVPKSVFDNSTQAYQSNPTTKATFEQEMQAVVLSAFTHQAQELTREKTMASWRQFKMSELENIKKFDELVQAKAVAPYMIDSGMQQVSRKAEDRFFNETGVEVKDIRENVDRLNLKEDAEYKAMVAKLAAAHRDFLASRNEKVAAAEAAAAAQ